MPQAIADPDDLERFAREIKQFNAQLRDGTSRLQAQFAGLSETWRDQEHWKFSREFEQTMKVLRQFMTTADQYAPFLERKARRLRDYHSQG